jgi:hypothetical protein
MKRQKQRRPFGQQIYQLETGLTQREAAYAAAKKARRDWRGMKYDPKTGKVILT